MDIHKNARSCPASRELLVRRVGRQGWSVAEAAADRTLVAVMPLRNLGPAEDEFFAAGITEEIITRLAKLAGLGVVSGGSTSAFRSVEGMGPKEIGEELGVEFVLSGSVQWARPPVSG